MTDLHVALDGWHPAPVGAEGRLTVWPATALAALLGRPAEFADGSPLPPLWHYLYLLETPAPDSLGEDGHPREGHHLPPIPDRRRMFAGARVRWHRPLVLGDVMEKRSEVASVRVKDGRSGQLAFVTVRTEYRVRGDVAVTEEQDLVYRSQPGGAPHAVAAPEAEDSPDADFAFHVGSAELFQFSALTYNAHRIHYDLGYARNVEGYPGLVVHGPLQAIALLEPLRRAGRAVAELTYRLDRPAFAGSAFQVVVDGESLTGGTSIGTPSITGTAR
ncbi:MaoC family dehydratase N-terminal domain-containing protein [Cryptosporangium sp. NPDC051539]|uniref:FAS1-like dehydratase domain-containing protein n=1 Tax=Cryptosporangium sp. NPDC051539 TaxID=3363962 RepID=UPI003798994A